MVVIYTGTYEGSENGDPGSRLSGREKRLKEHELGLSLLKQGLKEQFSIDEAEPAVEIGAHGKPYLRDYPHIYFNISHCSGFAACAVGEVPLGVDVERVRKVGKNAVEKALSRQEREYLNSLPEEEQECCFFRFWTLKESYGKALGCGLFTPLSKAEFRLLDSCTFEAGKVGSPDDTYMFLQEQKGDMILSVCIKGDCEVKIAQPGIFSRKA